MNPHLQQLQPYPFQRLRALFADITPNTDYAHISLGIGEPKHPVPACISQALCHAVQHGVLANYPATTGQLDLRQACINWAQRRYGVTLDAVTQVLPINGSREALFAFAQTVIAPNSNATVVCPNPFYQIYEGATFLTGAKPYFVASDPANNFAIDWASVPETVWRNTQLVYTCSPNNPTGAVMSLEQWKQLFALSDQYEFVIASDECYSEIYFDENAPLGGLQAAHILGRDDFKNLVLFTSLSKRSNVPGLRSGFVAGDSYYIQQFLLYRTYHGSAMSPVIQAASIAAWDDEVHVQANRRLYREKVTKITPILAQKLNVKKPEAGFFLWAQVNDSDTEFTRELYEKYNVTVLPGSFLARQAQGSNPGQGYIRIALVAEYAQCLEAVQRICEYAKT